MLLGVETGPGADGGPETLFVIAFVLVGLLVGAGFVFVGYSMFRSVRVARHAGLDPFTSPAQLIAQAVSGTSATVEQRLTQLDGLHRRGLISDDEHRTARMKALAGDS